MNLRRGLLRLWVILALAWVAPTTWLLWDELTTSEQSFVITTADNRHYEMKGPPGATKEQALQKFKDLNIEQLRDLALARARARAARDADQPPGGQTEAAPSDRIALLDEAYKRGILPPDMKAAYEEAKKRGLLSAPPIRAQSADGVIHEFPAGTSRETVDRVMKQYAESMKASNSQWPGTPVNPQRSSKLAEFRQKYPEYDDMSDTAFADALYRKYYSDVPRDEFNAKIGLSEEPFVTIAEQFVANWPRRREAVATVLLPPLGALVIGIGLFWVGQGFRTRSV